MSHLIQNYNRAKIEFVAADGNYLVDQDGKKYLDFTTGIGVTGLGFNEAVKEALHKQVDLLWHTPNLYENSLQEAVAEKLIGSKDYLAFFCNSGAEANEAAIKLARKATGKQEIITFEMSFHGRTFGSMSATGQDKIKDGFGDLVPHFKHAIFNDMDSVKAAATDDTAAVMLELIQGESGVVPAEKDFIAALETFCKEKGILLIVDEVQTGMGRTGTLYAFEQYGINPDIFTLAKGLANGVPAGSMVAKSEIAQAFTYGSHGSTFGGNKLAMAAAQATLEVLQAPGFLANATANAAYLKEQLIEKILPKSSVTQVRGIGYMLGIETTGNLAELVQKCRDNGLAVLTAGTNVIRLLPPLTLTKDEIDQGVAILSTVFE